MKITFTLLSDYLNETFHLQEFGLRATNTVLPLPEFYIRGMTPQKDRLYICRTGDLPEICNTPCTFLCIGKRPSALSHLSWKGCILYIEDRTDLLSVYNHVIRFYEEISEWTAAMDALVARKAAAGDLIAESIPLFENCITISDYNLRILANADVVIKDGRKSIQIRSDLEHIPEDVSVLFKDDFSAQIQNHEPFFYKGQRENPDGLNYCVNLYQGDSYIGTCTLWDKVHPFRERDFILFQEFARYTERLLSSQEQNAADQVVTMKTIFSSLLACYPVSREELREASDHLRKSLAFQGTAFGSWISIVVKSANRHKQLPESYFCSMLEDLLPHTVALGMSDHIVCFSVLTEGAEWEETAGDILRPYLKDMNCRAGVSEPFEDALLARDYYLQASAALRTGFHRDPESLLYSWKACALPYMLKHSTGEFEADIVLTAALKELRELDTDVDYWDTLKRYLNNECNASRTAEELYLHRSTLLHRLQKIREYVDLDTPESRLYLRMCMSLKELA